MQAFVLAAMPLPRELQSTISRSISVWGAGGGGISLAVMSIGLGVMTWGVKALFTRAVKALFTQVVKALFTQTVKGSRQLISLKMASNKLSGK